MAMALQIFALRRRAGNRWSSSAFATVPSQAKESTMNDHLISTDLPPSPQPPQGRGARNWLILPTVALAAALTGAVATSAMSDYTGGGLVTPAHFMGGHDFDPAKAEEHADRMVRHLAIEIDATNDQTEKLRGIVRTAVKDLIPLREKMKSS